MRVTNQFFFESSVRNVQRAFAELEEANRRTASGLAVERPSDAPVAASEILATSRDLRAVDQYERNVQDGDRRLLSEERVLGALTDLLARAKELGTSEAGDSANATSRAAVKLEVDQLFEAAVAHGNTFDSGRYLFGGAYADQRPFDASGLPSLTQPPQGDHQLEIGAWEVATANHDGQQVFLDSGVFTALSNLSTALGADDSLAIQGAIGDIDLAFDEVQELLTEVGARSNRLERASTYLQTQESRLLQKRSDLQDADLAEATIRFANQQTVLQGALLTTSRALSLTITSYLR